MGLESLVGNTPLLAIDFIFQGQNRRLFAKAENLNMTGSVKDRMALHIVRRAYEDGVLRPGDPIIEATSGNTGISFAAIGRSLGHPVTIFMPDWMSPERINLIRSFGATIHMVSHNDGGFLGSIARAEELSEQVDRAFLPRQFSNQDNLEAHAATTGPEIWWQLAHFEMVPDAFVAGVGTGGTIMGVGRFINSMDPEVKLHPVEPASSPTLSTGHQVGEHRIQGISDEFIPPIVNLDILDDIIAVDDGDAILMAQKLASTLGLGVGISSGANFIAALKAQEALGRGAVIATIFSDSNKKYLSTALLNEEPVKSHYLAPDVKLVGFQGINRVCRICIDPVDTCQPATVLSTTVSAGI